MVLEDRSTSTTGFYDVLASRKAEEAACRRYQATKWLESLVGPLGISSTPSEKEFISCLGNGLVLCNAINKVHPGAVTKVVETHVPMQSISRESQPLSAYQYFENVRNFLVAMEDLRLPAFEASDIERDTLEAGSTAKVVDCILALKSYHEHKNLNGGNGAFKSTRSPAVVHSASRNNLQGFSADSRRRLELNVAAEAHPSENDEIQKLEDVLVKALADYMVDTKENIGDNFFTSFRSGEVDPMRLFGRIVASCLRENVQKSFPEGLAVSKGCLKDSSNLPAHMETTPFEDILENRTSKCCQICLRNGNCNCNHKRLLKIQERELQDLKTLLTTTKTEFEGLQSQLQNDLKHFGIQVQEMASAAHGYHKVLKENRILYNMVQDLKGNIRVYCRVRPSFTAGASSAINFVGDDGSLVIVDPSKPTKDGRRHFLFNQVFGPTASQEDVFDNVQPLIRSVMDGYNVCIFAYGQTGSGKTYTMSGPPGGSTKELGINYQALNDLFQMSDRRKDVVNYDIRVQMVEIYNEQIRDLLAEDSSATRYPYTLEIRSCAGEDGLTLPDATVLPVTSTSDVLKLMKLGEVNRVVSYTAMNNRSSRSHSVLTVHVLGKDESGANLRGCLHLVDLAGSERVDKSEVTGDRLKEAQYINKSLSCLGDVVTALAQKNSHIPYRNSKLTLLLQDSLGGHAKTLMFAHVSPEEDSLSETVSTLKFAQRVSMVELGAARANKESSEIMQLKQVEKLKRALANKQVNNEARSPLGKLKAANDDKTPPRPRRLSIENKLTKTANHEDRSASRTPLIPTSSRRLSLEAPSYYKRDGFQTKVAVEANEEAMRKPLPFEDIMMSTPKKYNQSHEVEAMSKHSFGYSTSSTVKIYQRNPPRSPTRSSYQTIRIDSRTQIPHLQLPSATEHQVLARNEVKIVKQTTKAPPISSANNCKESQIRKSLRHIGKLINGSDKRNPIKAVNEGMIKSPIGSGNSNSSSRPARRESMTGVYKSRRSSLGGISVDLDNSRRNAKTPPPQGYSSLLEKRWH
ncbi:Kinesin-like protein KIN-14L [Linum perenne]